MGRDALATTKAAQTLSSRSFDTHRAHIETETVGQLLPHLRKMRQELRLLRDDGRIDVQGPQSGNLDLAHHMAQQFEAIGSLPSGVVRGEMLADITERGSTEQSIGNSMRQRVGVGVAEESSIMGNLHAPQYQTSALYKRVNVVSKPNSQASTLQSRYRPMSRIMPELARSRLPALVYRPRQHARSDWK